MIHLLDVLGTEQRIGRTARIVWPEFPAGITEVVVHNGDVDHVFKAFERARDERTASPWADIADIKEVAAALGRVFTALLDEVTKLGLINRKRVRAVNDDPEYNVRSGDGNGRQSRLAGGWPLGQTSEWMAN